MSKFGVSEHTVDEVMRIRFTKQLIKLRDDTVTEVIFSNELTNIERKFLHKLSEELGLKSKSSGVGENRKITVTKPSAVANKATDAELLYKYEMKSRTFDLLKAHLSFDSSASAKSIPQSSSKDSQRNPVFAKPATILADAAMLKAAYLKAQSERANRSGYELSEHKRSLLPAYHHKSAVSSLIKQEQIVLISGETGCGKTTQVPQFLLDDAEIGPQCRIVVTQPRRLSAISVSERIAAERGERIGGTIGYNIRLESEKSKNTQVIFVTPGVLLRKLQSDPMLEEFSHVIIDEAHERDRFTEFLLIVLRTVCAQRKSLKLLLMSATMQTTKLSSYFGNVPHIHIGGSVFPVQEFFLEHALRFTDYVGPVSYSSGVQGGGGDSALAAYTRSCQEYICSLCKSGPFKSPEELGTHCALCDGRHQTLVHGTSKGYNEVRKYVSAEELVRILSVQHAKTAGAKRGPSNFSQELMKAVKDVGKETKVENEGGEKEEEDVWVDVADDDSEEGGDEDENTGNAVQSVDVTQVSGANVEEDEDGTEALLKQYQYAFDDTQIDHNLIVSLLTYIFESEYCKEGSVLVFLPGWDDISRMARLLTAHHQFGNARKYKIIQLHSGIPRKTQSEVFEPLKPGEHKIILSTNIAETSVTIDDVAVVIDSGRLKEKVYDPHVKLAYLKASWISQASARQRKGRAGRTRAGVCFHLFSKRRHTSLPEFQDSEILRMPLEELVLQAKQLGLAPGHGDAHDSIQAFLQKALDPPHDLSIANAITLLQAINCLDEQERVTTIGKAVSLLPLDPRIGRIILLGCICGCGPAVLATSAAMGYRDPFVMPINDQQRAASNVAKARLTQGFPSDQIALLKALEGFSNQKAYKFCDENYLSVSVMNYLKDLIQQLIQTLRESGVNSTQAYAQRNNGNMPLLMSIISIGLYPDIGVRNYGKEPFILEKGRKAKIHPSSVNSKSPQYKGPCRDLDLIGYQDLVSVPNVNPGGAGLLMLNTTPMSLFSLLLTCGVIHETPVSDTDENEVSADPDAVHVEVDSWVKLKTSRTILALVRAARETISSSMDCFLSSPDMALPVHLSRGMDAIAQALAMEQPVASSPAPPAGHANSGHGSYESEGSRDSSRHDRGGYQGRGKPAGRGRGGY